MADDHPAVSKPGIDDVADIVASAFPLDMRALVGCSTRFAHGRAFLRALAQDSRAPRRLFGALRADAPAARLAELLTVFSTDAIVNAIFEYQTLIQAVNEKRREDVLQLLLQVDGMVVRPEEVEAVIREGSAQREAAGSDFEETFRYAAVLLQSSSFSPAVCVNGTPMLSVAAEAGLVDVVRRWLRDERCTAELFAQRDGTGHTPFTAVCELIHGCRSSFENTTAYMARLAQCAQLLGWDSRNSPATEGPDGANQLAWAACAGLAEVLRPWVRDSRTTKEVLEKSAGDSFLFGFALDSGADPWEPEQTVAGIVSSAMVLDILATHKDCDPHWTGHPAGSYPNMYHAIQAGAVNAVRAWLKHPDMLPWQDVERDTSQQMQRVSAWTRAAADARSEHRSENAVAILRMLAASAYIHPSARTADMRRQTVLGLAARAGLVDVVAAWLRQVDLYLSSDDIASAFQDVLEYISENVNDRNQMRPAATGTLNRVLDGARQCATLLAAHIDVHSRWSFADQDPRPIMERVCEAGLPEVLEMLINSPLRSQLKYNGLERRGAISDNSSSNGPFETLCRRMASVQRSVQEGYKGYTPDFMRCVAMLEGTGQLQPQHRSTAKRCKDEPASPDNTLEAFSNLGAACHAGLVGLVRKWLPFVTADALRPAVYSDVCDRYLPEGQPKLATSAFGLACERACDGTLSLEYQKQGADCARLLFSTGKVQATDQVETVTGRTAFGAAAQAGLIDICEAWKHAASPEIILKLAMAKVKNMGVQRWGTAL